jgi:hypothetical protein
VNQGVLTVMGKLGKRTEPLIPLGAKGALRGVPVEVLGYLRRYIDVGGGHYEWSEWQLSTGTGYRWLTEYNGHFHFVAPIAGGEVDATDEGALARSSGVRYRRFQTARARYKDIQGELNWRVRVEDVVETIDYTAPPHVLSCEREKNEVNWSRGEYVPADEVWAGLGLPGKPPRAVGVGMGQPNPYFEGRRWASLSAWLGFAALLGLAVFLRASLPRQTLASIEVPLKNEGVALSEPFELSGPAALRISASAPMNQSWAGLDVALIQEATGEAHTVGFELSRFEGVDDGERWREGDTSGSATLGAVPAGTYLLRAEVTLDPQSAARVPPAAQLEIRRAGFVWTPFWVALVLLFVPAFALRQRFRAFERARWSEGDSDDEGDDE